MEDTMDGGFIYKQNMDGYSKTQSTKSRCSFNNPPKWKPQWIEDSFKQRQPVILRVHPPKADAV